MSELSQAPAPQGAPGADPAPPATTSGAVPPQRAPVHDASAQPSPERPKPEPAGIDPRGPRFAAVITTVVLAITVLTASPVLLVLQTALFAVGAVLGMAATPYGWLYRRFLRPRLSAPTELEDPRPPRFAQGVGLVVCLAGVVGWALGADVCVTIAAGAALVAAFLNAAFGYCLGCELYLLLVRLRRR